MKIIIYVCVQVLAENMGSWETISGTCYQLQGASSLVCACIRTHLLSVQEFGEMFYGN